MMTLEQNKKQAHDAGFVVGFTEGVLDGALTKANGDSLTKAQLRTAAEALMHMPLSEIARRVLAADAMPSGAARLNAIMGLTGGVKIAGLREIK